MAVYNLTNVTDANNLLSYTQAINGLSEGVFGYGFFFTTLVILFMTIKKNTPDADTSKVLAAVLWFAILYSVILNRFGLVPELAIQGSMIFGAIAVIFLFFRSRRGT